MVIAVGKLAAAMLMIVLTMLLSSVNEQWNADAAESVRLSRAALQKTQQSRQLLSRAVEQQWIKALGVEKDSHNIDIALRLHRLKEMDHVRQLEFHVDSAGQLAGSGQDTPISVTALHLTFLADDAVTALAVIQQLRDSSGVWPTEIRACQLLRHQQKSLSVSCVAHTYYRDIST